VTREKVYPFHAPKDSELRELIAAHDWTLTPLGPIETRVATRLAWGGGEGHHLSEAELHTRVASPAPEADVRALIADAEAECPVCQAISGSMALRVTADVVSR